jgi:hypothetical protein
MAQTAAQKKAAEKKFVAEAQALIAKQKAQLAKLEKQKTEADAFVKTEKEAVIKENAALRLERIRLERESKTPTKVPASSFAVPGSNIFQMLDGILYFSGTPFTGTENGKKYVNGVAEGTTSSTTTEQAKELVPERTMAIDTFKNTLALFFGKTEMTQPWVNALYNTTSKFYKTGSTVDESLNLALQDVRNNQDLAPFTKRFKGLYELQDRVAKGEAIEAPTIAEFFKSQQALGDVMRSVGFADLATQEFLGDVLGTGKSVAETTSLITDVFSAIDNAPEALKKDLQTIAPGADRTAIAKALLMGKEGAAALSKQIAATSVFSAAKTQGVAIDMTTAADYAARGFDYGKTLTTAGNVALGAGPLEKLTEISTGKAVTPEQAQATLRQSMFENNVVAQEQIRLEAEKEAARLSGRPGTLGSRSFASRNRANRTI